MRYQFGSSREFHTAVLAGSLLVVVIHVPLQVGGVLQYFAAQKAALGEKITLEVAQIVHVAAKPYFGIIL